VVTNGVVLGLGDDLLVNNNQISEGTSIGAVGVAGNSVTVTNNSLSDSTSSGLVVEPFNSSTSVTIARNTFTQINTAIQLYDWDPTDAFTVTATIGGSPSEANTFVNSGGALGDSNYLLEMDGPTADVNAEHNDWGLCTAAEIEQEIYHEVDDQAQGFVDFEPFIAPSNCATPEPSPTPEADTDGDTVPDDVEGEFGSDPHNPDSTPESPAFDPDTCSDGVDNDGDGLIDAEDEGCAVAPTRTLVWGPGWHNAIWSGASTPEEAFACAAGNYAAAYRLVDGGWERHFPDRADLSNMTDLAQYDAFLILITGDVTCEMPVADTPSTERTLDWGVGWQNEGWTGPDGTPPQDALACAAGNYAAAYGLVSEGWERYFPDRPDISNMGMLDEYDAFLILVTAPVSCSMPTAA
jgi:hypothetical protein